MINSLAETSYRLLLTGPAPMWMALALFAVAAAFALWQLRLEFSAAPRAPIERWILPALRLGIVALIVWLIAQPVLLVVSRWIERPGMLVIVDDGRAMNVAENFGTPSLKLDVLESASGDATKNRNTAGSKLASAAQSLEQLLNEHLPAIQSAAADLAAGLPLMPATARSLEMLSTSLRENSDAFSAATATLPTTSDDKRIAALQSAAVTSTQTLRARCDAISTDASMVSREASRQPALLDDFLGRMIAARDAAVALRDSSFALQSALDRALLGDAAIDAIRAKPAVRADLATQASRLLVSRFAKDFTVADDHGRNLDQMMQAIFERRLTQPISRAIVLANGSGGLSSSGEQTLRALSQPGVTINTVLIGADGIEPHDAGLRAIDVPAIALVNQPIAVRAMVKNHLDASAHAALVVRQGPNVIASQALPPTSDASPYSIATLSFTPTSAGRQQFIFEIDTGGADAYAGNERQVTTIDVLPAKARVIVVADQLTNQYAAAMRVLGDMPCVEVNGVVAAAEIAKLKTGTKPGEFPTKADEWKTIRLAVLLGSVPQGLPGEAIDALKQAIDNGLNVFVQGASWADALGVPPTSRATQAISIAPDPHLWLPLYELGASERDSLAAWSALPRVESATTISAAGMSLLTSADGSILQLIPRGRGQIIFSGLPGFSSLRSAGHEEIASRFLAEAMCVALSSLRQDDAATSYIFPPQPVFGRQLFFGGAAPTNLKGLTPTTRAIAGGSAFDVTDAKQIAFDIAGRTTTLDVRQLSDDADFNLTAHAAPLKQIAIATGGTFVTIDQLPRLWEQTGAKISNDDANARISAARYQLWSGPWSLVAILSMVSAEYLLRRRAGRVM